MAYKNIKIENNKILISSPHLEDFFKHSVIFLTEHNEDGSIGFTMNKPTKFIVSDVIEDFPEFKAKVLLGGPVQTDLINFVYRNAYIEGSYKVNENIFWGGNFEHLKEIVLSNKISPNDIIFFLGYAGWSPNQLHDEFVKDTWFICNTKEEYIFPESYETLWHKILRDMGGEFSIISSFPENPIVN